MPLSAGRGFPQPLEITEVAGLSGSLEQPRTEQETGRYTNPSAPSWVQYTRRTFLQVPGTLCSKVSRGQAGAVGLGHRKDSLQGQVVILLGQELVERHVGVHGPHVLPQGQLREL